MAVKDMKGGERFEGVLLVRSVQQRETKAGKPFIKVEFGDASGTIHANVWDSTEADSALYSPGRAIRLTATVEEHERWGRSLKLHDSGEAPDGSYDPAELMDGPPTPLAEMESQLRDLIASVQQPQLARLLDLIIGPDAPTWPAYRDAPAAKRFHQAYRHGLLEHSLTVAQSVAAVSGNFPGIDRDLAVTGALIHDIGKLDAYTTDPAAIDFTDEGRLQGEIPLGYFRVKSLAATIDGFPPDLEQGICHIILSHHGKLEHGSPVVPQTREATLVHMLDHLGGQLGSFDRLEKSLAPGERWSGYDTAIGGGAWFASADGD